MPAAVRNFALNVKDLQVDSSGKTVVFFTEETEVVNPATVQQLVDVVNPVLDKARRLSIHDDVTKQIARGTLYAWADGMDQKAVEERLFDVNYSSYHMVVNPRKKYIAIDTKGGSGKFLVDTTTGLVHDIKGYGVIHPRHHGTLSANIKDPRNLARVILNWDARFVQ
jgi:hypothetical protein